MFSLDEVRTVYGDDAYEAVAQQISPDECAQWMLFEGHPSELYGPGEILIIPYGATPPGGRGRESVVFLRVGDR